MPSSLVDSGASSPPPLSTTRATSAAAHNAATSAASAHSSTPQRYGDAARTLTSRSSSSSSSSAATAKTGSKLQLSYGDRQEGYDGGDGAEGMQGKVPNARCSTHSDPTVVVEDSCGPDVSPLPGSSNRIGSGDSSSSRSSSHPNQHAAPSPSCLTGPDFDGTSARAVSRQVEETRWDAMHSRHTAAARADDRNTTLPHAERPTSDGAAASDSFEDYPGAAESRSCPAQLQPASLANEAAAVATRTASVSQSPSLLVPAASTTAVMGNGGNYQVDLPLFMQAVTTSPSLHTPSDSPAQNRGLVPPATAASGSAVAHRGSMNSTAYASASRASAAIGGWVPYTPPGPEPEVGAGREGGGEEAEEGGGGYRGFFDRSSSAPLAAAATSATVSNASSTLPSMMVPVRTSPRAAYLPSHRAAPAAQSSLSAFAIMPSAADDEHAQPPAETTAEKRMTEEEEKEAGEKGREERAKEEQKHAAPNSTKGDVQEGVVPAVEVAEGQSRRAKRRPPSLFAAAPAVAGRATTTGAAPGPVPAFTSSSFSTSTSAAAAATGRVGTTLSGGPSVGQQAPPDRFADNDAPSRCSPSSLASRAETSQLLDRPPTLAAATTTTTSTTTSTAAHAGVAAAARPAFSSVGYGGFAALSITPIVGSGAAAAEYQGATQPFHRANSSHYTANPRSASPSPASTGLLTLLSTNNGDEDDDDNDNDDDDDDVDGVDGKVNVKEDRADGGARPPQDSEDEAVRPPNARYFSQPPTPQQHPQQQSQGQGQQQQQQRSAHTPAMLAYSPPRPIRSAPLMRAGGASVVAGGQHNAGSHSSSSLASHSLTAGTTLAASGRRGSGTGFATVATMASGESSVLSVPTASLHFSSPHIASITAAGPTAAAAAGKASTTSVTSALSPGSGSLGAGGGGGGGVAAHYTGSGSSFSDLHGRATSGGTPSHSSFASPPTPATTNPRGTCPPPLALTPTPGAAASATTTMTTTTTTVTNTTTTAAATTLPAPSLLSGSAAAVSVAGATAASTSAVPSSLPPAPVRPATRRRAPPPPSLFKIKSPVTQNASTPEVVSPGSTGPPSHPSAIAAASPSAAMYTPPLHARVPVAMMGGAATASLSSSSTMAATLLSDSAAGQRFLGAPQQLQGGSAAVTPNMNTNAGANANGGGGSMAGSVSARPPGGHPNGGNGNSSSNALVRLSHDRRTLIAGMFRVSREGCLTVRNMLLLNPTRIDVATNPPSSASHGSPLGVDPRLPLQLLHPQRTRMVYSPVSSTGGPTSRLPLLHGGGGVGGGGGPGPMSPNTAGSDWCSPQTYGAGGGTSSAGFSRLHHGSVGHRAVSAGFEAGLSAITGNHHNSTNNTTMNPNASFTLFSTSMDTPFSPITYSLDSQRFAFPSSSGVHGERSGGQASQPVPQLLRAAREELPNSSATAFNSSTGNCVSEATPTTATTTATGGSTFLGVNTPRGVAGSAVQAVTPNSMTHNRLGGGLSSSVYRAQLRRQASGSYIGPGMLNTNAASPTMLPNAGSVGSMSGGGAFNAPDTAGSLLMPYADISTWKGGMGGVGAQTPSIFVGSPSTHNQPSGTPGLGGQMSGFMNGTNNSSAAGGGGGGNFTATSTAGMNTSGTYPHGSAAATAMAQLPPNVVRLRDLAILSNTVGEGASATVFVAIHKPTGRRLAVKRVDLTPLSLGCSSPYLRNAAGSNGRVRQLQHIVIRELQVLHLTYRSPFMVKVYNAFFLPDSNALDIVMEFMHYGSLDHLASALQKHSRQLRESQQQRNRMLTEDDDAAGMEGSPGSGSEQVTSSPSPQVSSGTVPAVQSPVSQALHVDPVASGSGGPSLLISGNSGSSGHHAAPAGQRGAPASFLSPKLLSFGQGADPHPELLRGRRLGLPYHGDGAAAGSPVLSRDGGAVEGRSANATTTTIPGSGAAVDGQRTNPAANDDEVASLAGDAFSVKSDCGTDENEVDDGSGLIEEQFGVTERLVAVVGEQLLRGVRDMHSRGYIHRDIKPGNVLINEHGVVKLSDFGLSQRCDDSGTGIRNPAMSYVPPPSVMPTRQNTPMHSPSMSALQVGMWGSRNRGPTGAFSPYAHRSLAPLESAAPHPLCAGFGSPETDAASDGPLLSSTTTNSLAAQRDGLDVLDAESTSSSDNESGSNAARGNLSPPAAAAASSSSSSSSSGAGANCSGTDKYMSPERQRGESHGKPADIWAVGVTLAEFAVGEYPYNTKDVIDEFDRVSRLDRPVDVLQFNNHRAAPLSTLFADFIHIATLPIASQRPAAQELLEHPFFKQWHKPFNLKDYLAARVLVPSNQMKSDYLEKQRREGQ